MTSKNKTKKKEKTNDPDQYWEIKRKLNRESKKLFSQTIFLDWCKACGICIAFCPKKVFERDESGKPVIKRPDDCNGCRFCELHCPDLAITIKERYPDRRRKSNGT